MARNGSGVYTLPAGSIITNGDVSDSSDLNTPLSDLETDMNTPRPVVAGGTGVASVAAAQTAFKIPPFDGAATISGGWTVSGAWTITGNQTFNDNVAIRLGTGIDTTFLHNGTNTVITDASAGLIAKTASFKVQNAAGTEDMIEAVQDSFVKLRFNNTARLTTTSTGVTITGDVVGDTISGAMVSTSIATDTGSTTKVPRVAAVETAIAAVDALTSKAGKYFQSAAIALVSDGDFSTAHGLGATPRLVIAVLVCTTANAGFAVGDELVVGGNSGTNTGITWAANATNIVGSFGTSIPVNAIGATSANLTFGSWELRLRAWL